MEDQFKRPNKLTGMPYESGFEDEDGKFFLKYLNKQGKDGSYYEESAKDKKTCLKKINKY